MLENLERTANTIDLIASIDMLSLGYHVDDLTGVIMMRNTRSDTIYTQQIGRCLSIKSKNRTIIFDLVGNLTQTQYHNKSDNGAVIKRKERTRIEDIMNITVNDVTLIDNVAEIESVERLISVCSEELKKAIIEAYLYKNAPVTYCKKRLFVSEEEFLHMANAYKSILGEHDKSNAANY